MGFWGVVNTCIKNSDIILLILDARVPHESRNREVEARAAKLGKRVVFVFNKSDLIAQSERVALKAEFPDSFFVSAHKRSTIAPLRRFLKTASADARPALRVSLIGYPNVGKSSLLNVLVPTAHAKVGNVSGTTKDKQWIRQGNIRFLDSPGVIPKSDSTLKVGITASKDPHKIKDPDRVAIAIIERIRRRDVHVLEKYYNITVTKGIEDYQIFLLIGQAKRLLVKKGEVDEQRTAIRIIEDWQQGKLSFS